jgi:DNA-binding winged helix-turn-helix (wHTH) protein
MVYPLRNALVGPEGEVHIEPKVMQVLEMLAESPGEVVGRDELLDKLWAGRAMSDEPPTRCIASLRQTLGYAPKDPKYIQTIPAG